MKKAIVAGGCWGRLIGYTGVSCVASPRTVADAHGPAQKNPVNVARSPVNTTVDQRSWEEFCAGLMTTDDVAGLACNGPFAGALIR
jgi:hypothetical protein